MLRTVSDQGRSDGVCRGAWATAPGVNEPAAAPLRVKRVRVPIEREEWPG